MPEHHHSLLFAYILDGNGGGKKVGWKEINQWTPEQGILWVHLDYTSPESARWLNRHCQLNKLTSRALLNEETRPRSIINPEGILVFLRGVNLNPGQDPEDMVALRIWIEENRIITTRKRPLLSIEDIRQTLVDNTGPKTSIEFLLRLNDALTHRIGNVLEEIEESVDRLEQQVLTQESRLLRPKIADIRRQAIEIRRYLAPQREALNTLYLAESRLLNPSHRAHLREATDRIIRHIEDLDSTRDRAAITQEELSSRLSEQIDHRMYVLSIVAVIFLPLGFITGLLGINVGGIPGANSQWGFLWVCGSLGAILLAMFWVFRKKRWL